MLTLKTEPGYVHADRDGYNETIKMVILLSVIFSDWICMNIHTSDFAHLEIHLNYREWYTELKFLGVVKNSSSTIP